MNQTIMNMPAAWADPGIDRIAKAGNDYLRAWQQQQFAFLPVLHESIERHARFFTGNVEAFNRNAGHVRAAINASDLALIAQEISEDDDPLDIADYLEVAQDAIGGIAAKLRDQVQHLQQVEREVVGLSVYDVSRDRARYGNELDKLARDRQIQADELAARQADLERLDEAIKVLEDGRVEELFLGSLPSAQELQAAASLIAAGGVSVAAVESALNRISQIIGAAMEGMRYAAVLDQRRTLNRRLADMQVALRTLEQRRQQTETWCARLDEYPQLTAHREQGLAAFTRLVDQLQPVWRQLAGFKVTSVRDLEAVQQLVEALADYQKKVTSAYAAGL